MNQGGKGPGRGLAYSAMKTHGLKKSPFAEGHQNEKYTRWKPYNSDDIHYYYLEGFTKDADVSEFSFDNSVRGCMPRMDVPPTAMRSL